MVLQTVHPTLNFLNDQKSETSAKYGTSGIGQAYDNLRAMAKMQRRTFSSQYHLNNI